MSKSQRTIGQRMGRYEVTRIEHRIVIDGPSHESYYTSKVLLQHLESLKTEFEKTPGLTFLHQWAADRSDGGSKAMKLAKLTGKTAKQGLEWLFKEEKPSG